MTRGIDFRFVYLAVAALYARMRDTVGTRATLRDPSQKTARREKHSSGLRREKARRRSRARRRELYEANRC